MDARSWRVQVVTSIAHNVLLNHGKGKLKAPYPGKIHLPDSLYKPNDSRAPSRPSVGSVSSVNYSAQDALDDSDMDMDMSPIKTVTTPGTTVGRSAATHSPAWCGRHLERGDDCPREA